MLELSAGALVSTAGNLLAERVKAFVDRHGKPLAHTRELDLEGLQLKYLQLIEQNTHVDQLCSSPLEEPAWLGPNREYQVQRQGRAHMSIYAAAPLTIRVRFPGMSAAEFAITPGWTQVDAPEGTIITTTDAAGAGAQVFIRYAQDAIGRTI